MRGHQGGSMGGQEKSGARRKRDARRRRAEEARWAALSGPVLTRMARQTCSGCGSARLDWGSVGDRVGEKQETQDWDAINEWLADLSESLGVPVGQALLELESWKCRDCGDSGVFGPTHRM